MITNSHVEKYDNISFRDWKLAVRELPWQPWYPENAQLERQIAKNVADVRSFYATLGVRDDEGNSAPNIVELHRGSQAKNNAFYSRFGDAIRVGTFQKSALHQQRPMSDVPDVMAHEWGHRVVGHIAPYLAYGEEYPETTAIGESLADTFAAAYDTDDWTIGEGFNGKGMRDMLQPWKLGDPGTVSMARARVDLVPHELAGVPNRAAALIGEALGRPTMAQIYLNTLRHHASRYLTFTGLAARTIQSAEELFGAESKEVTAVKQAWTAVEVLRAPAPATRSALQT